MSDYYMACPTLHCDTPTLWWQYCKERDKKSLSNVFSNSHVSFAGRCFDERLARLQSIDQNFRSRVEAVQFRQAYYCLHWNGTEACNAFNAMDDAYCIKCNEPNSYWVAERQAGLWGDSEASFTWKHRRRTARGNLISEYCLENSKQDCLKPLTVVSINLARCLCHNAPNRIAYWHLFLRCSL